MQYQHKKKVSALAAGAGALQPYAALLQRISMQGFFSPSDKVALFLRSLIKHQYFVRLLRRSVVF
jgi:hypothetical protein